MSRDGKTKLTQTLVTAALKRTPDGKQFAAPQVLRDHEVGGLLLIVGARSATWCVDYKPHGLRQDGKRHSKVRMKIAANETDDATQISLPDARTHARAIKLEVAQGRDPHAEKRAERSKAIADRAVVPEVQTAAAALETYVKTVESDREIAMNTRRLKAFYVRKAVRQLKVENQPLTAIDDAAITAMLDGVVSPTERWHLFGALRQFLAWASNRKRRLIERNPCDDFERNQRPGKPRSRDNVPSVAVLKAVWKAVENEPAHARDLFRFLLLVPLRRAEAVTLTWVDVDLAGKRVSIPGTRTKNRERHELPLAHAAVEILEARRPTDPKPSDLVFGKFGGKTFNDRVGGKTFNDWGGAINRIRKVLGQAAAAKETRFTFHDVRRSFVSGLAGRFDLDLLDQCLGHTRKGVFGTYQRSARWPERVAVLDAWADLIAGAGDKADNVVPFSRSA